MAVTRMGLCIAGGPFRGQGRARQTAPWPITDAAVDTRNMLESSRVSRIPECAAQPSVPKVRKLRIHSALDPDS